MVTAHYDSLPYIDMEPSQDEADKAKRLIEEEIFTGKDKQHHPDIAPLTKSFLTESLEKVVASAGQGNRLTAIDIDKYSRVTDDKNNLILHRALLALGYSIAREENLALLARYGKNQWLMSNSEVEQDLKVLVQELEVVKSQEEQINGERKRKQLEAEPTFSYLDSRWRNAVKGLVDVNVACLELEGEIKRLRAE